jgi:unsaturated rhamnogalacturonyl hydrolase
MRAIGALAERFVSFDDAGRFHLGGICKVAGLGGKPYRDGSYAYYLSEPIVRDDYKGTGPFTLALVEACLYL